MYDNLSRVIEVDINEILPNRFQPRIQFDEEEILELSDSIKEHGVIQPIVVRTIGDKYEIIAGERRYKASVLAGRETVPVIVKNLNDKDSAEIALIENIQRKNLTPIEEALSYKKILDMGYITQENLAVKLGKSQSSVANKIRLLNLSDEVQEALLENKISERHARSLLKLTTTKDQNEMLNRIINERLTVRRADEEIEKIKNNSSNESNDEEKIIEKGEIDMNNNMFGMPSAPVQETPQMPVMEPVMPSVESIPSVPNFDIFGGAPQPVAPSVPLQAAPQMPVMEPVMPSVESVPSVPNFDIFGGSPQPVAPSVPLQAAPQMSVMEPVMPSVESVPSVPNFDIFGGAPQSVAPSVPVQETPQMPIMEPVMPSVEPVAEIPAVPVPPTPELPDFVVPTTTPIMDSPLPAPTTEMTQQSENLFSFGDNNVSTVEVPEKVETTAIPEFKMPEPIIVTDYSKQYDPVMPTMQAPAVSPVDFKEIVNAIRECSSKIEKFGYKIDVEEYDLANLYQVIFKIEK